jgi:phage tail-like protein
VKPVPKKIVFKLQIKAPEGEREVTLNHGTTRIGREPGNEIQLNYGKVSRRHAELDCTEAALMITDVESANGTLVNGERIIPKVPVSLADNSVIEIDPVTMVCQFIIVDEEVIPVRPEPEPQTAPRKKAPSEKKEEKKEEKKIEKPAPKKARVKEVPPITPKEPPPPPPEPEPESAPEPQYPIPPGLSERSIRYLDYLPGIYRTDFMERLMALFEVILMPIEWNIDNFDMYLDPSTAPEDFLPWLSNWFEIYFDQSWKIEQRQQLLAEAHQIFARRGTRWALSRLLEIYTEQTPEIIEFDKGMQPYTFKVTIKGKAELDETLVMRIINANKPAHTSYTLEIA